VQDSKQTGVPVKLAPKPGILKLAITGPSAYKLFVNGKETPVVDGQITLTANEPVTLEARADHYKPLQYSETPYTPQPNATITWDKPMEMLPYPYAGEASWENSLGMKFVAVPGVNALFGVWDTRVQDYQAFLADTKYSWTPPEYHQDATHPVAAVSWVDAKAFCRWLTEKERKEGRLASNQSYRLPTDAEWSLAAGLPEEVAGSPMEKNNKVANVYPWGNEWPPQKGSGNFADKAANRGRYPRLEIISGYDDGFDATSPVGTFTPNQFGLYDMGGNVWQWCEDEFRPGSPTHARVLRGGSFEAFDATALLSSHRNNSSPNYGSDLYGFRCVVGDDTPSAAPAPAP